MGVNEGDFSILGEWAIVGFCAVPQAEGGGQLKNAGQHLFCDIVASPEVGICLIIYNIHVIFDKNEVFTDKFIGRAWVGRQRIDPLARHAKHLPPSFFINHDITNFIRYKTPEFTFDQLLDPDNSLSPFVKIKKYLGTNQSEKIEDELKLLANVVRTSLRNTSRHLVKNVSVENMAQARTDIRRLRAALAEIRSVNHFSYVDEFISNSLIFYMTGLLNITRKTPVIERGEIESICLDVLNQEKQYREKNLPDSIHLTGTTQENEYILYRTGLLNKFVLDSLMLNSNRSLVYFKYRNLIAAISAGIAMLIFLIFFVWQGEVFIINSIPFILITVLLYIIKDRLKEGLRDISYKWFMKWYPDYKTEIFTHDGKTPIGYLEESFSFIPENEVPEDITAIRNREFHAVLESVKRPERIIYYKRNLVLNQPAVITDSRKNAINNIFRFNVHDFVEKADDPEHSYITVDPQTGEFINKKLPKVYHLNIIIKNTSKHDQEDQVEYKKFRLILDKNGIKRKDSL